jgi:hypothetical protein
VAPRALRLAAAAPQLRRLCTEVAEVTPQAKAIGQLEEMKARLAAEPAIYEKAKLQADLEAGSVDTELLDASFEFSDDFKKAARKLLKEIKENQAPPAAAAEVDWAMWSEKLDDPELVAKVKAAYEDHLKDLEANTRPMLEEEKAEQIAEMKAKFAPLYEEMSKEEKAADATLMTCIAEMELLTKQMEGISEQTIAEILEQEPEMRKEIEEELENNVWAP